MAVQKEVFEAKYLNNLKKEFKEFIKNHVHEGKLCLQKYCEQLLCCSHVRMPQPEKGIWGKQKGHMHGRIPWPEETTEHVLAQTWAFNC